MIRCGAHPAVIAAWQCSDCSQALCEDCAAADRVGRMPIVRCAICGGLTEELRSYRDVAPYWRMPLIAAQAIARPEGLLQLLALGLLFSVLDFALLLAPILQGGFLIGYLLLVVRHVADGKETLPQPDLEHVGGAAGSVLRFMVASLILWLPLLSYLTANELALDVLNEASTARSDPIAVAIFVVVLVLLPVTVMVAAIGDSLVTMLHPGTLWSVLRVLGRDYLGATLVWFGVLAVQYPVSWLLDATLGRVPIPVLVTAVDWAIWLAVPVMSSSVLGRVLYQHGERLGLLLPDAKLLPQRPEAEARGLLRPPPKPSDADAIPDDMDLSLSLGDPLAVPNHGETLEAALNRGDDQAAYELWRVVRAGSSVTLPVAAEVLLAGVLERRGEAVAAAHAWSRAVQAAPEGEHAPGALLGFSRLMRKMGKTAQADALLDQLRTRFPDHPTTRDAAEKK